MKLFLKDPKWVTDGPRGEQESNVAVADVAIPRRGGLDILKDLHGSTLC